VAVALQPLAVTEGQVAEDNIAVEQAVQEIHHQLLHLKEIMDKQGLVVLEVVVVEQEKWVELMEMARAAMVRHLLLQVVL
jgi:hypothetical protein